MSKKLIKKEDVEKILEKELGPKNERFFVISTEKEFLYEGMQLMMLSAFFERRLRYE